MRKIESLMLAAIKAKQDWQNDNTRVEYLPTGVDSGVSDVYLYGNHIALVVHGENTSTTQANWFTFATWPTTTTRSRLRALGITASIRKGKACIDGHEITTGL